MGAGLVGKMDLENGEEVFVTSLVRHMDAPMRANVDGRRSARILDADGNLIEKTGMLAFGHEPNRDADDGTFVGFVIDVAQPETNADLRHVELAESTIQTLSAHNEMPANPVSLLSVQAKMPSASARLDHT